MNSLLQMLKGKKRVRLLTRTARSLVVISKCYLLQYVVGWKAIEICLAVLFISSSSCILLSVIPARYQSINTETYIYLYPG